MNGWDTKTKIRLALLYVGGLNALISGIYMSIKGLTYPRLGLMIGGLVLFIIGLVWTIIERLNRNKKIDSTSA